MGARGISRSEADSLNFTLKAIEGVISGGGGRPQLAPLFPQSEELASGSNGIGEHVLLIHNRRLRGVRCP
jgi:hypothetical protein